MNPSQYEGKLTYSSKSLGRAEAKLLLSIPRKTAKSLVIEPFTPESFWPEGC